MGRQCPKVRKSGKTPDKSGDLEPLDLSFYNFEADSKRRRKWIVKIKRDPDKMFQVIIELHFNDFT